MGSISIETIELCALNAYILCGEVSRDEVEMQLEDTGGFDPCDIEEAMDNLFERGDLIGDDLSAKPSKSAASRAIAATV